MGSKVTLKQLHAAAEKRKTIMLRASIDTAFPSGGRIESRSTRPQTIQEVIDGLVKLRDSQARLDPGAPRRTTP